MPRVTTYPASARFKFGDGRLKGVRCSADFPAGTAGYREKFTACGSEAESPVVLRTGAVEALGGQLVFSVHLLTLLKQGVDIPLKMSNAGQQVLSLVGYGKGRSESVTCPTSSATYFGRAFTKKSPNLPNGGLHIPYTEDGLSNFEPPRPLSTCKAVTLGDATDGCLSDPKKVIMKLHVSSGPASVHPLKRVLVDSDRGNMHSMSYVDLVSGQCEIRRATDKAPQVPIAGTPTVSMSNEKL